MCLMRHREKWWKRHIFISHKKRLWRKWPNLSNKISSKFEVCRKVQLSSKRLAWRAPDSVPSPFKTQSKLRKWNSSVLHIILQYSRDSRNRWLDFFRLHYVLVFVIFFIYKCVLQLKETQCKSISVSQVRHKSGKTLFFKKAA